MQQHLLNKEYVGEAGAGLVKITINAAGIAKKVDIDDSIFNNEDKNFISDLFCAALNDAIRKADADIRQQAAGYYGSLPKINLNDLLGPKG